MHSAWYRESSEHRCTDWISEYMTIGVMPLGDPFLCPLFSQIWFVNDSTIVCLSFWNLLSWFFNPFFFGANYSLTLKKWKILRFLKWCLVILSNPFLPHSPIQNQFSLLLASLAGSQWIIQEGFCLFVF